MPGDPRALRGRLKVLGAVSVALPVAHLLLLLPYALASGRQAFGGVDWAVNGALLVVLGLALGLWWRGHHEGLARLVLVQYATVGALAVGELALLWRYPLPPAQVPLPPISQVATASNQLPGISGEIRLTVNLQGLRGPNLRPEEADVSVLCVGGSTTLCLYVSDRDTWPWQLQERLARATGQRVFVGNAGQNAAFVRHYLHILQHYPPAARFQYVVMLAGVNDLALLLSGRYVERLPHVAEEALTPNYITNFFRGQATGGRQYRWSEATSGIPWYRSLRLYRLCRVAYLMRTTVTYVPRLGGDDQEEQRQRRRRALAQNTRRGLPADTDAFLARYRADLCEVVQLTRTRGQQLVLLTQPTLFRADLEPDLQRLLIQGSAPNEAVDVATLAAAMDRFNQVVREVASAEQVPLVDLDRLLPKDTRTFYDDCHFNIEGCGRVANAIAPVLAELVRQAPPRRP